MKKFIYMAALLMLAALTLTACGDDEPKVKTTATATYNMTFSQDLLEACNVLPIRPRMAAMSWRQSIRYGGLSP